MTLFPIREAGNRRKVAFCLALLMLMTAAGTGLAQITPIPENTAPVERGADGPAFDGLGDQAKVFRGEIRDLLITAGEYVDIDAVVHDDVIVAGGDVELSGVFHEDLFAAAGNLIVNATVSDDVLLSGGRIRFGRNMSAGGSVKLFGGAIRTAGEIDGDLFIAGRHVTLEGVIRGDVRVRSSSLALGPGLRVGGTLHYRGEERLTVPPDVEIAGGIEQETSAGWVQGAAAGAAIGIGFLVTALLGSLIAFAVLAAFFHFAVPGLLWGAARTLNDFPAGSIGLGFALALGLPLAAFILVLTLVGMPIAFLLVALYGLLWLMAVTVSAGWIAQFLGRRLGRNWDQLGAGARYLWLVLGGALLLLAGQLPFVGWLIALLLLLGGIGAVVLQMAPRLRQ
ncbi:MAG: hypothetical protein RLP16_07245 [Alphaproteobacteria bacterium]